jgi:hypothetical protein
MRMNRRRQARVGVGILDMFLEYIVGEIGEIWGVEPKAGSTWLCRLERKHEKNLMGSAIVGEIWEVKPKAGSAGGNRNFQYRTFKDASERKKISQSLVRRS